MSRLSNEFEREKKKEKKRKGTIEATKRHYKT
jgi:hypothetical protein